MITRFGYYYNTFGKQIPVGAKSLPTFGKIHSAHPDFPLIATQYIRYLVSEEKINSKLKSKYVAFDEDVIQTTTLEELIETIPADEDLSTNLDKTEVEDLSFPFEIKVEKVEEVTEIVKDLAEVFDGTVTISEPIIEEVTEQPTEEVAPEVSENLDKNVEEVKQDEVVAVVDKPTETKKSRKTSKPKSNEQKEG